MNGRGFKFNKILRAQQKHGIKLIVCGVSGWSLTLAGSLTVLLQFLTHPDFLIHCLLNSLLTLHPYALLTSVWLTFIFFVWHLSLLCWQQTLPTVARRCQNGSYALQLVLLMPQGMPQASSSFQIWCLNAVPERDWLLNPNE